jgi:hypothetical protein
MRRMSTALIIIRFPILTYRYPLLLFRLSPFRLIRFRPIRMKEETALRLAVRAGRHKRVAHMTGFPVLRKPITTHQIMPDTRFSPGPPALHSRFNRFSAAGGECLESVVFTLLFFLRAFNPRSLIGRSTRFDRPPIPPPSS